MTDFNMIHRAILLASMAHAGQTRKGTQIPYIVHPLSVAIVTSRHTNHDATIAAAILHDTVEDTDLTLEEIRLEFGARVAELVEAVTETLPDASWKERKNAALARVSKYDQEMILMKSADVMCNCHDLMNDYSKIGDELWARFNQNGGKGNMTDHYIVMLATLHTYCTNSILRADLFDTLHKMKTMFQ